MQTLQLACAVYCPSVANNAGWAVVILAGLLALEVLGAFLVARYDTRKGRR